MLNYASVLKKEIKMQDLAKGLNADDLARELNEMYDRFQALMKDSTDADVVFQPVDPNAHDPYAEGGDDNQAWTLGHVVVHFTASMEESAALSAELARGVEFHGRSRWETDWTTVKTVEACRSRVEESRRMALGGLAMWPDQPNLENAYAPYSSAGSYNCVARFLGGLTHAFDHLGQVEDIVKQAKAARETSKG
ncbi:MAG: DinB family protein [Anaerolineales bacterium]|nr:DinB family protein [Anaerolineales bacterium]